MGWDRRIKDLVFAGGEMMNPEDVAKAISTLEQKCALLDERSKSHEERLQALEKTQAGILDIRLMIERLSMGNEQNQKSFDALNARLDRMDDKIGARMANIEKRLDAHEKAPGEKWEKASWQITILIIGGVVGYLINLIIPMVTQK